MQNLWKICGSIVIDHVPLLAPSDLIMGEWCSLLLPPTNFLLSFWEWITCSYFIKSTLFLFFFLALPKFKLGLLESCNSIKYFIWVNHIVISFNFYILVVLLKYTNLYTLLHVLPNTFCIGMSQKNIHYLITSFILQCSDLDLKS